MHFSGKKEMSGCSYDYKKELTVSVVEYAPNPKKIIRNKSERAEPKAREAAYTSKIKNSILMCMKTDMPDTN